MSRPASGDSLEKFLAFQREVNRLFRRIFEESAGPSTEADAVATRANVSEEDGEIVVELETPGIPRENLTLWASRDLLVVEGDKPGEKHTGRVRFHHLERDYGRFRRVLEIPSPVDGRGIRAVYDAGLLTIRMPKIEDRRGERHRVPIEGPGDP